MQPKANVASGFHHHSEFHNFSCDFLADKSLQLQIRSDVSWMERFDMLNLTYSVKGP